MPFGRFQAVAAAVVLSALPHAGAQRTCAAGSKALAVQLLSVTNTVDCIDGTAGTLGRCDLVVSYSGQNNAFSRRSGDVNLGEGPGGRCTNRASFTGTCEQGVTGFSEPSLHMCLSATVTSFSISTVVTDIDGGATSDDQVAALTVRIPASPTSGTATGSINGYTVAFSYLWVNYTVSCGSTVQGNTAHSLATSARGFASAEHMYIFNAPIPGSYTFDLCGSSFDTSLSVFGATSGALEALIGQCDDSGCSTPNMQSVGCGNGATNERVTVRLGPGLWILMVEGYGVNEGAYTMRIECSTLPPSPRPTHAPTNRPTDRPSPAPTSAPTTSAPTTRPTVAPTFDLCDLSHAASLNCDQRTAECVRIGTADRCICRVADGYTQFIPGSRTNCTTSAPTLAPTASPTAAPTFAPTAAPTAAPSAAPTFSPTARPTKGPTAPTAAPTVSPTVTPTARPSETPTATPTLAPTAASASASGGGSGGSATIGIGAAVAAVVLCVVIAVLLVRRRGGTAAKEVPQATISPMFIGMDNPRYGQVDDPTSQQRSTPR